MRKQIHASYALLTRASNFPSPSGLCIDRGNDGKKERELDYVGRARDAEWQVGRRLVRRSWSIAVAIQSVLWLFKKLASFGSRVGSFNFGCPCRSSARARREYVYISPRGGKTTVKTRKKGGKIEEYPLIRGKEVRNLISMKDFVKKVVVSFCPTMNDLLPLDEWNGWREGAGYSQSIIL